MKWLVFYKLSSPARVGVCKVEAARFEVAADARQVLDRCVVGGDDRRRKGVCFARCSGWKSKSRSAAPHAQCRRAQTRSATTPNSHQTQNTHTHPLQRVGRLGDAAERDDAPNELREHVGGQPENGGQRREQHGGAVARRLQRAQHAYPHQACTAGNRSYSMDTFHLVSW